MSPLLPRFGLPRLMAGLMGLLFAPMPAWSDLEVRVMSFNVRWDGLDQGTHAWTNRRPLVADVIRRQAPDVVALQEPSLAQTHDLDADLEAYVAVVGAHERDQHLPFLYRTNRFQLADHGSFWLVQESELSGGTRRCVWIRLQDRATGKGVVLYNNHWDHRSASSRQQSARALLQQIGDRQPPEPFIVLGDFNEVETGGAIKLLTGTAAGSGPEFVRLVDTYRELHAPGQQDGTGHGFDGRRNGSRIDFIFASPGDQVRQAQIIYDHEDGRYPSDHFPVLALIRLRTTDKPNSR